MNIDNAQLPEPSAAKGRSTGPSATAK
jgi:hypothetical protein